MRRASRDLAIGSLAVGEFETGVDVGFARVALAVRGLRDLLTERSEDFVTGPVASMMSSSGKSTPRERFTVNRSPARNSACHFQSPPTRNQKKLATIQHTAKLNS